MMFLGLCKLGNICCGHRMFLNKIRNIFVSRTQNLCPQQMLRVRANGETFVSATMCPQQCVLVCQGLKPYQFNSRIKPTEISVVLFQGIQVRCSTPQNTYSIHLKIIRDSSKFSMASLSFGSFGPKKRYCRSMPPLTSKWIQYLFVDNFQVRKNRWKFVIVIHDLFKIQNLVVSVLLFCRGRLRNLPEFITHVAHVQNGGIAQWCMT